MDVIAYYEELHSVCRETLRQTFGEDTSAHLGVSHNYVSDLEKWIIVLSDRPECRMLESASREYQFALLAVVQGQYRQAFSALRLFLELSLGAVYFSANELKLHLWYRGEEDLVWSSIVHSGTGVFSKKFARCFFEGLEDEVGRYRRIAGELYRECSEYVHGNAGTQEALPQALRFSGETFCDWCEKDESARLVVSFALAMRHLNLVKKSDIDQLEPVVLDELRHLPAIRSFFGGPVEE